MAKNKLQTLADELEQVMNQKMEIEQMLDPLKEKEDAIRAELVDKLLKQGFKYVKTSTGLGFGITNGRVTYKVKKGEEQIAIVWAQENYPGLLSLISAKLNQVVKPMLNPPDFLERIEGAPFLSVRATENDD